MKFNEKFVSEGDIETPRKKKKRGREMNRDREKMIHSLKKRKVIGSLSKEINDNRDDPSSVVPFH